MWIPYGQFSAPYHFLTEGRTTQCTHSCRGVLTCGKRAFKARVSFCKTFLEWVTQGNESWFLMVKFICGILNVLHPNRREKENQEKNNILQWWNMSRKTTKRRGILLQSLTNGSTSAHVNEWMLLKSPRTPFKCLKPQRKDTFVAGAAPQDYK
jgi:hypothetical protein